MTADPAPAADPLGNPDLPEGYDNPARPESFVPQQFRNLYRVDEDWELVELAAEMARPSGFATLGQYPGPVRVARNRAIRAAYGALRDRWLASGVDPADWPPPSMDVPASPAAFTITVGRDEPIYGYRDRPVAGPPAVVADQRFMLGRVGGIELPRHADAAAIAEWRHRMRIARAAAELARERAAS